MMYVDLNPIRAGVCETPGCSDYTSIQERLLNVATNRRRKVAPRQSKSAAKKTTSVSAAPSTEYPPIVLLHFSGDVKANNEANTGIPFGYSDYLTLLDGTGRAVRNDKRGAIPAHVKPLLQRLNINDELWVESVTHFGRRFHGFIGSVEKLRRIGKKLGRRWLQGVSHCKALYAA